MKKGLVLLFAVLICALLCACASNSDKEKETTTNSPVSETTTNEETTEESKENKTIDFSTDKGDIKYVGFEKANSGLVDESNVYIIKFAFTNKQDAPSQSQSAFYIQFFQNGVEINNSLSYSSTGGEQYKLVGNFFSSVMKGGTVTYGKLVQLEDNSPITIMVSERGENDSYQMMELDVTKKPDKDSNSKDSDSKSNEPETKKETTTSAVKNIWSVNYYVDDFDQPTDEWYITNSNLFSGTFSNSATTNSNLTASVLVDSKKDITFFLYEYGRNEVKNSSEQYVDTYNIVMRTPDGKDHKMTGTLYCGGDRIFIDDKYVDTVLKALQGDGDIMFRFVQSDRTINTYLITVTTGNFGKEYKSKTK